MPDIKVVIANDQDEAAFLWQRVIDFAQGMTCIGIAKDGDSAVEMVKVKQPDVVLMDVMMPGKDGFQATREVLETLPETQIIVFSARVGTRNEAFAAGACEYLLMPILPDDIVSTIRRVYETFHRTRG